MPVPPGRRAAGRREEEALRFILQVKKTVERCLGQGMNKSEMFRVIREEGLPLWIAFAVYRELREQNNDFFKEYYCMLDLKEQREKLGRLIQAYGVGGSNADAGSGAPETATAAAAMETDTTDSTISMEWLNQQAEQGSNNDEDLAHLASSTRAGDQIAGAALPQQAVIAGAALPQQAVHFRGSQHQQLHGHQQTMDDGWLREMARMLDRQQLQNNEQSLANGMFQGVAWRQQAPHLPALPQLHYQAQAAHMPAGQQPWHQGQVVQLPAGQQLRYQEQAGHLPVRRQLHYQQQAVHLPAELQLIANGGFYAPPITSAAGVPNDATMGSWPLLLDGHGWGQGQQAGPQRQWCPPESSSSSTLPGSELPRNYQAEPLQQWRHADSSSSSTLPGLELQGNQQAEPLRQWWPGHQPSSSTLPGFKLPGNQNYSSNAGFHHERPQ